MSQNQDILSVDNISVIKEEYNYNLYIQTAQGTFSRNLDPQDALSVKIVLENSISSIFAKIISDVGVTFEQCCIFLEDFSMMSSLKKGDTYYTSFLAEVLPLAIELNVPLFIDKILISDDYKHDPSHEAQVAYMLEKETYYWESCALQFLKEEVEKAVHEERYEEAARLMDKIKQIQDS
ncbi:MAG: hypothetical protein ACRCTQ_02310 [Brevinemataceae bacterium]